MSRKAPRQTTEVMLDITTPTANKIMDGSASRESTAPEGRKKRRQTS